MYPSVNFSFIFRNWQGTKTPVRSFLKQLEETLPWKEMQKVFRTYFFHTYAGADSDFPEVMLRILMIQEMYNLSYDGLRQELDDNKALRDFCQFNKLERIPSDETLSGFRDMMNKNHLYEEFYGLIVPILQHNNLLPVSAEEGDPRQIVQDFWKTYSEDQRKELRSKLPRQQIDLLEGLDTEFRKILYHFLRNTEPEFLENLYSQFPEHRPLCEYLLEKQQKNHLSEPDDTEISKHESNFHLRKNDILEIDKMLDYFRKMLDLSNQQICEYINCAENTWFEAKKYAFRGNKSRKKMAIKTTCALHMTQYEAEYFLARSGHGGLDEENNGHNCIRHCLREKIYSRKLINTFLQGKNFKPLFILTEEDKTATGNDNW